MTREFNCLEKSPSALMPSPVKHQQRHSVYEHESGIVPPIIQEVLRSTGQSLEPDTLAFFEQRFGHDFSQVQIHANAKAAESAEAVEASAYTVSKHVVFGAGQYAPRTKEGQRLIAHELTHIVQQGSGVQRLPARLAITKAEDAREKEAETASGCIVKGGSFAPSSDESIQIARQASPPASTTEDCKQWQATMLRNHLNDARKWVNDAERKIADYAYVFASTRHCAVPASPATATVVRNALLSNFHTVSPSDVLNIRDNFTDLRMELNGSLSFECEDEGCDKLAYVRGLFAPIRRLGDIHVCPLWFCCPDYYARVTTLIHERAHQYPGAFGDTYEWESSYATLSAAEAMDNAESYAVAARQIYHGGAHGPGTHSCPSVCPAAPTPVPAPGVTPPLPPLGR